MSFKPLFAKSLGAAPSRLHFAAHSHHLWPDASFEGQVQCWEDAARFADTKWDKVMDEVWPEAQGHVAAELGSGDPSAIVFASNTHDFLIRLQAACPRRAGGALRVLTSDGEFHSARRQFARWAESGGIELVRVPAEPFGDFSDRFLAEAEAGGHDLILVSQVLFNSGRLFDRVAELAALARPDGPWVVIDGYHAFMAIESPLDRALASAIFYLGGGYKYAMAGEAMGFMHCPPDFGPRPTVTGWFDTHRSLAVSLVSAGMGMAPMTMSPLVAWLVTQYDWRQTLLIVGVVAWALTLPAVWFVRASPIPEPGPEHASASEPGERTIGNAGQALRSRAFIVLALTFFACCAAHSGPIFHTVSYAVGCGLAVTTAVTIYSMEGAAGLGGRVLFGLLADRLGAKPVLIAGLLIQAIAAVSYLGVNQLDGFYAVAIVFGMAYGGTMPLYASLAREAFSPQILGRILGAAGMLSALGMALGPLLGGWLFDRYGSYTWMYIGSMSVGLGAAAIALWFPSKRKPRRPEALRPVLQE